MTLYPGVEHPDAIEADYQMLHGMPVLDLRAISWFCLEKMGSGLHSG